MKYLLFFILLGCLLLTKSGCQNKPLGIDGVSIEKSGYSTPENYDGMKLIWQEEFEGTELNLADWTHDIGAGIWGNNELEYYQDQNTSVRDGYLVITAKKENAGGRNYTSSRIKTQGKKEFQFGRIDIRALLPKGQGIWPALWMLGNNISTVDWPACGEIDIMEMIGGEGRENTVHGTAHWDSIGNHVYHGGHYLLPQGKILAEEFHVFSVVWTSTTITWYLDDVQYYSMNVTRPEQSEFQNKFFFICNVAVGGDWPGSPDASTTFPQRMLVDYIRVFQQP